MNKKRASIPLLLLVLAAVSIVYFAIRNANRASREREQQHRESTVETLLTLQTCMSHYQILHSSLPSPPLEKALAQLEKDGKGCGIAYYDKLVSGLKLNRCCDGWGRALVYELQDQKHGVIRSNGPNGLDEKGGADDIEVAVPNVQDASE